MKPLSPATLLTAVFLTASLALPSTRAAESFLSQDRPVGETELKIGLSNAQSGRSGALGSEVRRGCEAFVQKLNAAGGIHGRKLTLVAYDDRYEPLGCMVNTQRLVNDDKVFALCNYVGTPTSMAVLPMVSEAQIPLVGLFSGAAALREPVNPFVFNVRASYGQETEALVEALVHDRQVNRVAVFIQNDAFGEAVRAGVARALQKRDLKIAAVGSYARNTADVDAALEALTAGRPQAIIMGGTYQPCAALVRAFRKRKLDTTLFCSVSFIGTESFIEAAGQDAEDVYISQVLPSPADANVPLVAEYQAAIRAREQYGQFTYASLEGYTNAAVLAAGLRRAGPQPTTAGLVSALEGLDEDLGGLRLAFNPAGRQGLKDIYLTRVTKGLAQPVTNLAP